MSEAATLSTGDARRVGAIRIAIGFVQGLALWGLTEAEKHHAWPSTEVGLFGALFMAVALTPFVLLGGLTTLQRRSLAVWGLFAAAVLAGIGLYDAVRRAEPASGFGYSGGILLFVAAGLFVAHHLVEGGDAERRLIARYPRYFDVAWKHGVQIVLSAAFVGVFWGVLLLGAGLFDLIGVRFVSELIGKSWFVLPATATMFAAAVHLTDVRSGLIRGVRTVVLTLLAWLLPVLALLAAAFLAALPFTGLDPLWKTRSAAAFLLGAAAVMIVLINAAYQDGEPDGIVPLPLRLAGRLGGLLLAPLVGLAAYALWLRIAQHGLTPDRVVGAALALVGGVYAVGYAWAAIRLGRWMRRVEVTNIAAAFVGLAVLLAVLSPLADPAKLSVNDQMARLKTGRVTAERFDYDFLRHGGEVYGRRALQTLKAGGGEAGRRAVEALERKPQWERPQLSVRDVTGRIEVWPAGAQLPESFRAARISQMRGVLPGCLTGPGRCDAAVLDLDGDARPEVLLWADGGLYAFAVSRSGEWELAGRYGESCAERLLTQQDFQQGRLRAVEPLWKDLQAGDLRLSMTPNPGICSGSFAPQP
ncbi:DUF4153 domain-containing protein [Caulobacter mirabilis]|uniref:DUF4153 domain-containing protein n=1 Tax=Caulobacter mirabilis TaxID=69666 RepID=A0A2D2AWK3_9CAUL|nr:DUF4153 domain-containing protein [Caulobacter mirabilis]ATQ42394.1 DUF4153 domain-containing protein [Caulobacter mirabilis]